MEDRDPDEESKDESGSAPAKSSDKSTAKFGVKSNNGKGATQSA